MAGVIYNVIAQIIIAVALGGKVLLAKVPEENSFFEVEVDTQGVTKEEECSNPNHGVDLAPLHVELLLHTCWYRD